MENLFKKEIYKNLLVQLEQLEWNRMKVIKLWTTHLYSRWAYKQGVLYPGGLLSGIIYSLANG